eukprot:163430-Amphidinium_carterae.1
MILRTYKSPSLSEDQPKPTFKTRPGSAALAQDQTHSEETHGCVCHSVQHVCARSRQNFKQPAHCGPFVARWYWHSWPLGTFPQDVRYDRNKYWRWVPPQWFTERFAAHAVNIVGTTGCTVFAIADLQEGVCTASSGLHAWGLQAETLHKSLAYMENTAHGNTPH